jgi:SPP1 family predicted phage head-tail adaptor
VSAATPGALRRRVTIEAPADLPDGAGGVVRGFAAVATAFAAVEPVSAEEAAPARALGLNRLWKVTLRALDGLGGGHRVIWGGRPLDVLSVRALDADDRFLELLCEEVTP